MPRLTTLIDAYIEANIVLICAFVIWRGAQFVIVRTQARADYGLRLKLAEGLILVAILSPLLVFALSTALTYLSPAAPFSLSDLAIAQFLQGRVEMPAENFETILGLRQSIVSAAADPQTLISAALVVCVLLGIMAGVVQVLRAMIALRGIIECSYLWRRFEGVDIRLSDHAEMPFSTRGLLRRYIIVPSRLLGEPKMLRIALAHELQHMRRADTEWELGLSILRPLFFWNPAFGAWKADLEALRELTCDQVLLRRRRVTARGYAECLLSMCRAHTHPRAAKTPLPVVPLVRLNAAVVSRRNRKELTTRVLAIIQNDDVQSQACWLWGGLGASALVLTIAVTFLQTQADWSQDRLMLSTIVNLERLESRQASLETVAGW